MGYPGRAAAGNSAGTAGTSGTGNEASGPYPATGRWPKEGPPEGPALVAALEKLVDPTTRGDPESCLRWTCKSVRKLSDLSAMGHKVSYPVVAELLHELGYQPSSEPENEGRGKPSGPQRSV